MSAGGISGAKPRRFANASGLYSDGGMKQVPYGRFLEQKPWAPRKTGHLFVCPTPPATSEEDILRSLATSAVPHCTLPHALRIGVRSRVD